MSASEDTREQIARALREHAVKWTTEHLGRESLLSQEAEWFYAAQAIQIERALRAAAEAQYRHDEPSALREDEEYEIEVAINAGIKALSAGDGE